MTRYRTHGCATIFVLALFACDPGGSSDSIASGGSKSSPASSASPASGGKTGSHSTDTSTATAQGGGPILISVDLSGSNSGAIQTQTDSKCDLVRSCEAGTQIDGTLVSTTLSQTDAEDSATITQQLAEVAAVSGEQFANRYATGFAKVAPTLDPSTAEGMQLLQSTNLALDSNELTELKALGFVITERNTFPNYVYGYESLYMIDLPLFVSADSVLYAIHQSFDSLLRNIEEISLIPTLNHLLSTLRSNFGAARAAGVSDATLKDVDLYLTVAASLLAGSQLAPVGGADPNEIGCILKAVNEKNGCVVHDLFGVPRVFDFSQFTVRGHYASSRELSLYFQAMMWLGRTELRLIETLGDGKQQFNRRELQAALALRALFDDSTRADWQKIDVAEGAFVGENDSMTLPELDSLMKDLGASTLSDLDGLSDQQIAQAIISGRYGTQRIASQIIVSRSPNKTLPLSSSFLLLGQRYIVDSHVLSNVVYDRVIGEPPRMMPNPLDVAFAALGNDQAWGLLQSELDLYGYRKNLADMRVLVDAHPDTYWDGNLYNHWVNALRALSTAKEAKNTSGAGLPSLAGSEAWGRRLLNTQLASWAELRHDTLLYAKQSYTTGMTLCDYPDAYVEPYPEFWARLVAFAEHGRSLTASLDTSPSGSLSGAVAYFTKLGQSMTILKEMAERQRSGSPHDPAHIAFINQAVRTSRNRGGGCGGGNADATDASGWYADLFFEAADKVAWDPTIADVHTQPTDTIGSIVGRILHVGTGAPRLMVMVVENCSGPHAYVGMVSSYFERITDNFKRLTDQEWSQELLQKTPEDVPWMRDLVVR